MKTSSFFRLPAALPAAMAVALAFSCLAPRRGPGPDLAGFGRLPVLEGGRVKPIDTVAKTALLMLRGKQSVAVQGRNVGAVEWLLDAMARPEKADAYPAFVIDDPDVLGLMRIEQSGRRYFSFEALKPSLGEIREQAAQASKLEAPARNRFQAAVVRLQERLDLYQRLKNTLQVSGTENLAREIQGYGAAAAAGMDAVNKHQRGGSYDRKALAALAEFFERYRFLSQAAYFHALPPVSGDSADGWTTMGAGLIDAMRSGALHPAVAPLAGMLAAYRAADAATFDRALGDYRSWLKARLPNMSAMTGYESVFNRVDPLYKGILLYLAALLAAFASWLFKRSSLPRAAFHAACLAWAAHSAGLFARIWLQGRPPVTNLYSSAVFVGWVAAGLGLLLERMHRNGVGTAVSAAIGSATLLIAHHLTAGGDTMEMMRAVLDSNFWLGTHVVAVTTGYSSTFLAGALAHVYLLRRLAPAGLSEEDALSLNKMTYGVVCFSLFFSFVGTVLGGIWADQSWGRFWGWDPKENGALLIVLWNAVILHARWGGFIREKGLMVMAVFGNIITSLSWFGVNMLGIGLHSYGWMDKAFYWLAAFVASQLGVMALAALPARRTQAVP